MKSMLRWFLWVLLYSQLGWVGLASARGTVLILGFQPDGRVAEHAEQAVTARLKRFADVALTHPRTPPEPEILSCETAACLMPVALRESADFVLLGRVVSSEHARLGKVYLLHVGRQELLSDEAGCEECNERTVVDLTASVAARQRIIGLFIGVGGVGIDPGDGARQQRTQRGRIHLRPDLHIGNVQQRQLAAGQRVGRAAGAELALPRHLDAQADVGAVDRRAERLVAGGSGRAVRVAAGILASIVYLTALERTGDFAVVFPTNDIWGMYKKIKDAGYVIISPPVTLMQRPGYKVQPTEMMFRDRDGVLVNLLMAGVKE